MPVDFDQAVPFEPLYPTERVQPDGTFAFTNLPPGRYRVAVAAHGYVAARSANVQLQDGTAQQLEPIVLDPVAERDETDGRCGQADGTTRFSWLYPSQSFI